MLKHNLVLHFVVQVTRTQKQFLQALFEQKVHLLEIEETRSGEGLKAIFLQDSRQWETGCCESLEIKGKIKGWKKTLITHFSGITCKTQGPLSAT